MLRPIEIVIVPIKRTKRIELHIHTMPYTYEEAERVIEKKRHAYLKRHSNWTCPDCKQQNPYFFRKKHRQFCEVMMDMKKKIDAYTQKIG